MSMFCGLAIHRLRMERQTKAERPNKHRRLLYKDFFRHIEMSRGCSLIGPRWFSNLGGELRKLRILLIYSTTKLA